MRHPGRQCVSPEDLLESDGQQGRSKEPVEDDQARASSGGSTAGLPGAFPAGPRERCARP